MKFTGIILLSFLFLLGTTSCKEKGCTYPHAENYNADAKKDDESCTFLSDKLIGAYTIEQDCLYGGASSYSMTIVEGGNKGEVILQNLDNSVDIKATIDGTNFSFKEDKAGITYEGSGYMVGANGLTINLEICETFYYPCSDPESCTLTGTK